MSGIFLFQQDEMSTYFVLVYKGPTIIWISIKLSNSVFFRDQIVHYMHCIHKRCRSLILFLYYAR